MPLTTDQQKILRSHKHNLSPYVLEKGLILYKEGKVTFDYYEEETESFYFLVKGNVEPHYQVMINLMEIELFSDDYFGEEEIDCSCVYFLENYECKHVAAAIFSLEANKQRHFSSAPDDDLLLFPEIHKKEVEPPTPRKKLAFPIEIPCELADIPKLADKMTMVPDKRVDGWLRNVLINDEGYDYVVDILGIRHKLSVEYSDGKIVINGLSDKEYLVVLGLQWLKYRYKQTDLSELDFLSSVQRREAMYSHLNRFSLQDQIKDPSKAFKLEYSDDQVLMKPVGPLRGFFHLENLSKNMEESLFAYMRSPEEKLLENKEASTEWGLYHAAFALVLDYRDEFEMILPFMAKGNKKEPKELKVKFTVLEDPYDMRLGKNPDLERIMLAVNRVNHAIKKKGPDDIHSLFGEFLQLASAYQLFVFQGESYEIRTLKKKHFEEPLQIMPSNLGLKIRKEGIMYGASVVLKEDAREFLLEDLIDDLEINQTYVTHLDKLFYFRDPQDIEVLEFLLEVPFIQVLESEVDEFVKNILLPMSKNVEIIDESGLFQEDDGSGILQRELYITELTGLVIFRPQVKYGENAYSNPLEGNTIMDPDTRTLYLRDEDVEDEYLALLRDLHPCFGRGGGQGFFHLTHDAFMENLWFMKAFERL
ncbi:MAG TPA: hypothetical protein VK957_06725 [Lunatimonas sp.]|nr:hypothetical protein [Lunatimonas sp.]